MMEIIMNPDAAGTIMVSVFFVCATIFFVARWYFEYKYEKAKLENAEKK